MTDATMLFIGIGVAVGIALIWFGLAWRRRVLRRRSRLAEAWGPSEVSRTAASGPAMADEIDREGDAAGHLDHAPDEAPPPATVETDDGTAGEDIEPVASEAIASDLGAQQQVVVVLDRLGVIVGMSREAHRILDGLPGATYLALGALRPAARAKAFAAAEHPIGLALGDTYVDDVPCVIETEAGTRAGLFTTRPVDVSGTSMILVLAEFAVAT